MKKPITAIMLLILIFISTGCRNLRPVPESAPQKNNPSEERNIVVDWPSEKEDTVINNGRKETITIKLYENQQHRFRTYFPIDMRVKEVEEERGSAVYFYIERMPEIYSRLFFYPEDVKQEEMAVQWITSDGEINQYSDFKIYSREEKRKEYHWPFHVITLYNRELDVFVDVYFGKKDKNRYFAFINQYPAWWEEEMKSRTNIIVNNFYWEDMEEFLEKR